MRNLLAIVSMLIVHFSFGQTGIIGTPGVKDYASTIVADNSGNTYIGGSSNNELVILKRNSLGGTLWSNTIPLGNPSYGIQVDDILLVADTLFGCGHVKDQNNDYIKGGAYFKIDANTGNCNWLKYDMTSVTYFSSVQYDQGKLILCGSRVSYPNNGPYDGKVIAVNSGSGNMLWETPAFGIEFTSSSADYIDDFQSSTTIENGKMYMVGRSYVDGAPLNMRPVLIGIDVNNNGAIFLSKYLMFNINTDFSRVYGTSIQRDGTELVLGFVGDYFCSACTNYRTGLLKCDLNGNVIWSKYYDINGATNELNRNVNITPDGYVIYGQAMVGSEKRLILLKTNKQGDFMLGKFVGQPGQNISAYNPGLYSLASSVDFQNGMHHFAGNIYQTNTADCDIFYLKADNNTLLGDNSCFTYEDFTVTTTIITPYSGNVLTIPYSYPITYSSVSSVTGVNVGGCPQITVDQQHSGQCGNDSIVLSVIGLTAPDFTWSNGATGNSVVATTLDTLTVTIHDPTNCCSYQETVVPFFQTDTDSLSVELPADTLLCLQPSANFPVNATVTTGQTGVSYSWNTGEHTQTIDVVSSGTYIVTAQAGCSVGKDTIVVEINYVPQVDLGADLQLCSSQFPYTLNPSSSDVDSWLWSTGETTPSIVVSSPGTIQVSVSNTCGTDSDEMEITQQSLPQIDLVSQIDTCLNPDQNLLVSATVSNSTEIEWSNGQSGVETTVSQSGTYTVVATNSCGVANASVEINIYRPLESLPAIISSCDGFVLLSDYIPSVFEITSSDVDLTNGYVENSGWIICSAETACGSYTDSVFLDISNYDLLFFQNSFTPNGDQVNDVLELMVKDLKVISIDIFDRWGEVVYTEEGGFSGWNGTYKGEICPDGVYVVQLIYQDCMELNQQFNGHVCLLK